MFIAGHWKHRKNKKMALLAGTRWFLLGVIVTMLISGKELQAQDLPTGHLSYPLNQSFVIYDFNDNRQELDRLHGYISELLSNRSLVVSTLEITGYSSPDGSYNRNKRLSEERAHSLSKYMTSFFPRASLQENFIAEDWNGLLALIKQDNHPSLLQIQRIVESNESFDDKEKLLKELPGGVYKELSERYFPRLRRATLNISTIQAESLADTLTSSVRSTPLQYNILDQQNRNRSYHRLQQQQRNIQERMLDASGRSFARYKSSLRFDRQSPRFGVGTDILLWAGLRDDFTTGAYQPNLSLEYYFSGCWSLKAAFSYSNKKFDISRRFQGRSSYMLEPRRWIKKDDSFRGIFMGIYFQMGDYNDVHLEDGRTGDYYSAGLSAGYVVNIYRNLYIEANLRGGYRHLAGDKYLKESYRRGVEVYNKDEISLTGTSLSLIYRF